MLKKRVLLKYHVSALPACRFTLQTVTNLNLSHPHIPLPAALVYRSTKHLMTRKTRRRNKSRGADLEAQPEDEGVLEGVH